MFLGERADLARARAIQRELVRDEHAVDWERKELGQQHTARVAARAQAVFAAGLFPEMIVVKTPTEGEAYRTIHNASLLRIRKPANVWTHSNPVRGYFITPDGTMEIHMETRARRTGGLEGPRLTDAVAIPIPEDELINWAPRALKAMGHVLETASRGPRNHR